MAGRKNGKASELGCISALLELAQEHLTAGLAATAARSEAPKATSGTVMPCITGH